MARVIVGVMIVLLSAAYAENNGLARTPPMGWNPYNHFSGNYNETIVRAHAALLVSLGLKDLGYEYVNLDAKWGTSSRGSDGRLVPNENFPGIADGSLAAYIHGLGLRFGIYGDMGTLDCGGSQGNLDHEEIDAHTFASWGVDYLKSDNCNVPSDAPSARERYTKMSKALNATGRPILFAMCEWGQEDPALWGGAVANAWRTTGDISDYWWAMVELADLTAMWFDHAGPGGWNDPDMLEVGNGGMTEAEYRSHFSIWALLKAPLILGTDLRNASTSTLRIIRNKHVISINQDSLGVAGRLVEERPPAPSALQAWAAPLSGGRAAVALWNRGETAASILCRFSNLQWSLSTTADVFDAWANKALKPAKGQVEATVQPHDVVVLILTPQTEEAMDDAAWAARWRGHGIRVPQSLRVRRAATKTVSSSPSPPPLPLRPSPSDATITSGLLINDTDGNPLHAHGAGLFQPDSAPQKKLFYMVGTSQKMPPHWLSRSINLYSSDDLQNWDFEGIIFESSQVDAGISGDVRIERPKLLYNLKTETYVMWFHLDDASFSKGYVGVATCKTINGKYTFKAGWRPDGFRSLDMTLVQTKPGYNAEAFLVRSVDNQYVGFSRLTDDFLNTTSEGIVSQGPRCEGQAVWAEETEEGLKHYLLCSHLTGWHANPAILAESSTGDIRNGTTWKVLGNPTHKGYSYDSQPTYVFKITFVGKANGTLRLYMGDRWNEGSESAPGSVGGASYVWLPMMRNKSDPTGFSMPLLHGKWNATGTWKVADYLDRR